MEVVNAVRAFREQAGLAQQQLGEAIGVTRQTVAAWETGDRAPSLANLTKVAKVLDISVDLLLPDLAHQAEEEEMCLLFRADKPSSLTPALRRLLTQKAVDYASIERLLDEVPALPEQRPLKGYDAYIVEEVAQNVRSWLGVSDLTPLGDIFLLLESKGLKIITHPLPDDVSGFSAYTNELGAVIFVHSGHPTERQFHTALHELAHLIFHRQDYRNSSEPLSKTLKKDPREKASDHLAGAVALSEQILRKELHGYQNRWIPEPLLADLKLRYGISMRSVLYRAAQLGFITKTQMGQQMGMINKKYGHHHEEPKLKKPAGLSRLERLTFRALLGQEITASRAAEILGQSLNSIRMNLQQWMEDGKS
ncbi:XRE family transcriptional regulator [Leptolyngbya sp. PCC 6406]|uniref:XRE family transcriptional regulator n=1 Tax=Leptolyngbya sp. PCC 6406 TaxID=1173264 RepID=UPI0002ABB3CA|nr:XRE family transcriptional regulator [Leptolyngbya sp. PCC 6406]